MMSWWLLSLRWTFWWFLQHWAWRSISNSLCWGKTKRLLTLGVYSIHHALSLLGDGCTNLTDEWLLLLYMWFHLSFDKISHLCLKFTWDSFGKHFQLLRLIINLLLDSVAESDDLVIDHALRLLDTLQTFNCYYVLIPNWFNDLFLECLALKFVSVLSLLDLLHAMIHLMNALIEGLLDMSVQLDTVTNLLIWQFLNFLSELLLYGLFWDSDSDAALIRLLLHWVTLFLTRAWFRVLFIILIDIVNSLRVI